MSIRVLLALLSVLSLAAILALAHLAQAWVSRNSGGGSEGYEFLLWLAGPFPPSLVAVFLAGLLVFALFFAVLQALVVRPLRLVSSAMSAFAQGKPREELPPFFGSPRELREFARIWSAFAGRVEESHAHDVEMSRVKSDFISTAAHQLRTPLTGIRWALEALQKEALTESQKLLVQSATDKSHDLVGIVGTLLDITSIESGKHKYAFAPGNLSLVAAEAATDFLPLAKQSGVELSCEPNEKLPPVRMDRERMKWVLNNLIENAIRYTPSGGSVRITAEAVGNRVIVRVRDTGIGIRDEDRNNIFERFYRAGNAVAKDNQGNGLGLYIARSIVNDHQGELSFEGNEGPGTTFILALPAAR